MPIEKVSRKKIKAALRTLKPGEINFSIFDTILADANGRAELADNPELCKKFWQSYRDMIKAATDYELAYSRHLFLKVTREQFTNGLKSTLFLDKFNAATSHKVVAPKKHQELADLIQQNEAENSNVQDYSNFISFPKQVALSNQLDILTESNFVIRCLKVDRNLRILRGVIKANDDNLTLGRLSAIDNNVTRLKEMDFLSKKAKRILREAQDEINKRNINSLLKGKSAVSEIVPMVSIFKSAINAVEEKASDIRRYREDGIKKALRRDVIETLLPIVNELLLDVGAWHELTKNKKKKELKILECAINSRKENFLKEKVNEHERESLKNSLDIILYKFLEKYFATKNKGQVTFELLVKYGLDISLQMLHNAKELDNEKLKIIELFSELQYEHNKKDKFESLEMPLEYQSDVLLARLDSALASLSKEHQEKIADDFSAEAITYELSTNICAVGVKQRDIREEDKNAWKEIRDLKKSFYRGRSRSSSVSDSPAHKSRKEHASASTRKSGVKGSAIIRSADLLEKATAAFSPATVRLSPSAPPSAAPSDLLLENAAVILSGMTASSPEINAVQPSPSAPPSHHEEQPTPARRLSAPKISLDSNVGRLWQFYTDRIEEHEASIPLKSPGRGVSSTTTPRSARSNSCTSTNSNFNSQDKLANPVRVSSDSSLSESPRVFLGDPSTPRQRTLSFEKVNPVVRGASAEEMNTDRKRSSSTEKDERSRRMGKAAAFFATIGSRSRSPSDGDVSPPSSPSSPKTGKNKMSKVTSVPRLALSFFGRHKQPAHAGGIISSMSSPPASPPQASKKATPRYRSTLRRTPGSSDE